LLLIAVTLLWFESDLLWKVQQYNLFLDTPHFFREQMVVSGGLLSYVSCYFTQFFFHPWIGVLMLCGWWLLLMWLTKRTFRIADNWAVLALIPVAILLVIDMSLGYWHYFMRFRGYFFVPTIGTTAAVAMLWAFRALPSMLWLRILAIVVATAVGYPLLGVYGLAAVLLMGIWVWRLSDNYTQNAILTAIALLCIVAVPLFCYRYVYYQTFSDDIWTTAMPAFVVKESYPIYYTPYYILGGFFLLMAIFYQKTLPAKWQKPLYNWSLQGVLVVALVAGVWHFWYKDANFHHELAMQRCIEDADWEGVIHESEKQGDEEPTRPISLMHDIALWRLGRQLDEMYIFPRGNKMGNTSMPFNLLYHVFGRMIYYQYGMLNDCHRMCMEDGVEYGWRIEVQKYLARCFILNGEKQAARKILYQLRHTMYHGKWADDMLQLLDQPKQLAENREMGPITHMLHYTNSLGFDSGNVENYVRVVLSRQDSNDPYFQEQAVIATLWKKDHKKFWPRFIHYARLHPHSPIPRIFQEAAYFLAMTGKGPSPSSLPIDESVKKSYDTFMKEVAQYKGRPVDLGRVALGPFFGNTYYYNYYFQN
jgi:hypothetical protein